jgi:hypothetical protein
MRERGRLTVAMLAALIVMSCFLAINTFGFSALDNNYRDESHCLTIADMRGEKDNAISCFCRDAIVDSRYVYFTYVKLQKDPNLNGVFLALVDRIAEKCGENYDALDAATHENWNGMGQR